MTAKRSGTSRLAVLALLCSLPVLGGCGAETSPRLGDAGPRPAEPPAAKALPAGATGAVLTATGRQTFEGRTPVRCVSHGEEGLQINLRTGDPELPAVALRIEDFEESGAGSPPGTSPYRGRLFVTGRTRTGALAGSIGEVSVEVERRATGPDAGALVLSGTFEGVYQGEAGKGSLQGRFAGCPFALELSDRTDPVTGP